MVICRKCKEDLDENHFYKDKKTKNGLCNWCKTCSVEYNKEYRKKNNDRLKAKQKEYYNNHRKEIIENVQKWEKEHKEERAEYYHERYENKKEEISIKEHKRYEKNKEQIKAKVKKYTKEKYKNDPKFCIKMRLRHRLREAFKRYSRNGKVKSSSDYGIDYEEIFKHLGPCPGELPDYHIDHIKPLCLFDFDNLEQIKLAFAPENHQWLPKEENLAKHNKFVVAESETIKENKE